MTVGMRPVTYQPRAITTQDGIDVGGWTVKRYAVSALRDTPPEPVHAFAVLALRRSLPPPHPHGGSHAFSVVHEDEDGCYAVAAWWSLNRVILHTRTWLADWSDLTAPTEAPGHATACLWELAVIAHERRSWLTHIVRPPQPDVPTYLADAITDKF
ncbi:hypothetical protein [Phytohabitans aurantiacus]|uniref:hypothetical protein n=1 Tax=Phytohabitans aurantiacus TaxID=3016789 RepID=UPI0024926CDF|nr:hypothetical protein [Phytohabitans aurantiacus]